MEKTTVRNNLMNNSGYSPYCGDGRNCGMPRTIFNGEQFNCPKCSWTSEFPKEFIDRYKAKWNLTTQKEKG